MKWILDDMAVVSVSKALPTPLADFTANAVPMLLEKWKRVLVLSIRERKFRSKSGPRNGSF